jgi:hypothetical protein
MSLAGLPSSSLADTNDITYPGHGFETNDPVFVRAVDGGTLPDPLQPLTTYYVRRLNNDAFELAAEVDGDAIDLTTDSFEMVVAREPDFDMWIEFYSRWTDTSLPAHVVPLGRTKPVPALIVGLVADMVAERMFNVSGQPSTEAMKALEVATAAQLARFATGIPLRDEKATPSANLAVTVAAGTMDPRGWGSGVLP